MPAPQLGPRARVLARRGADVGSWCVHKAGSVTTALAASAYLIFRVYL